MTIYILSLADPYRIFFSCVLISPFSWGCIIIEIGESPPLYTYFFGYPSAVIQCSIINANGGMTRKRSTISLTPYMNFNKSWCVKLQYAYLCKWGAAFGDDDYDGIHFRSAGWGNNPDDCQQKRTGLASAALGAAWRTLCPNNPIAAPWKRGEKKSTHQPTYCRCLYYGSI